MFAMFHCGRPDILPVGDLAVRKGFQTLYALPAPPSVEEMEALAEPWRPFRSLGRRAPIVDRRCCCCCCLAVGAFGQVRADLQSFEQASLQCFSVGVPQACADSFIFTLYNLRGLHTVSFTFLSTHAAYVCSA